MKIKLILIIVLYSISADAYQVRWDAYRNVKTNAINSLAFYSCINNGFDYLEGPLFVKATVAQISSWPIVIAGHEYSHGESFRRLDLEHSYRIGITSGETRYKKIRNPLIEAYTVINGLRYEKALRDITRKEQLMSSFNYKNATLLFSLLEFKVSNFFLCKDSESNDFKRFNESMLKLNSKSNLNRKIKYMLCASLLDPFTIISSTVYVSSYFGHRETFSYNGILPAIDYNLYPTAATYELSLSKKIKNTYAYIGFEYGYNVYNNKVYGVSIENTFFKNTNIELNNKLHWVKNCVSTIEPTLVYHNYFVGCMYNFKKCSTIEKRVELFIGVIF